MLEPYGPTGEIRLASLGLALPLRVYEDVLAVHLMPGVSPGTLGHGWKAPADQRPDPLSRIRCDFSPDPLAEGLCESAMC